MAEPWQLGDPYHDGGKIVLGAIFESTDSEFVFEFIGSFKKREHAERAVLAVNAHDALLAACRELLAAYEDGFRQCHCTNGGFYAPAPCVACQARAAIAQAEKGA